MGCLLGNDLYARLPRRTHLFHFGAAQESERMHRVRFQAGVRSLIVRLAPLHLILVIMAPQNVSKR